MKIYQLNLKCFKLEEMKEFYTNQLEMPLVSEAEDYFAVMAGTTKIVFEKDANLPFYHLCLPSGLSFFNYMYDKMKLLKLLVPNEEGEYSLFWKGKQAYFTDPDGNILELLERSFMWDDHEMGTGWHCVGEIGLPVDNVHEFQSQLDSYRLNKYRSESDSFAFFGDENGVFVVVREGRPWYPTDREATIHPIRAIISGDQAGHFKHYKLPYEITVRQEWKGSMPAVQVRVARPTNQIDKLLKFYHEGLGLRKVGEFRGHDGYDGIMLGLPDNSCHIEFTQTEKPAVLPIPTKENLLVFYLPNIFERDRIAARLRRMGYPETEPENPYWARGGITIEDPEGWRVVLMNTPGIG